MMHAYTFQLQVLAIKEKSFVSIKSYCSEPDQSRNIIDELLPFYFSYQLYIMQDYQHPIIQG